MKSFRRQNNWRQIFSLLSFFGGRGLVFVFAGLGLALMVVSSFSPTLAERTRVSVMDSIAPIIEIVAVPLQTITMGARDVTGLSQLKADNKQLRADNEKLRQWYQTALFLEAENKALKDLLNVKTNPEYSVI